MLTIIERIDAPESLRLLLAGKMSSNGLGEVRREIEEARRLRKRVVLDLGEVTLVDRQSVEFLSGQSNDHVHLINCPCYIEPWIGRQLVE
jgi:hypothetical protein